jgi:CHAT domain-containing protein/Flp pilus assembly protein TadD
MVRYSSLLIVFLLFMLSPHGQDSKALPEYQRLYHYAEKLFSSENASAVTDSIAFSVYMQVISMRGKEKNDDPILADSYLKCGILKMSADEQEQALAFFRQSIAAVQKAHHLPDSLLFKPYLYAGSIQYNLNSLDSAVYYYKKTEAINQQYPLLSESERLFNKLGALYYETGDYKKSISYFQQALAIVETRKLLNEYFIVNYKSNIATALLKLGENKQALELFKTLLPYHIAGDQLFYNIGNAYTEEGDYISALQYLRRIKQLEIEKYNSLSKVFIRLKQYDTARLYLSKAGNVFLDKKKQAKSFDYGITLKYTGDLLAAEGKTNAAIENYQLAITHLDPVFKDTSVAANPSSFTGLQNFAFLFDALVAKAAAFNTLKGNQSRLHALNAYVAALSLAKHIERTYFSDDARLFIKNRENPATRDAVDIAVRLFNHLKDPKYLNLAFGLVENNKASVLQAGIQNLELSSIPGLPATLVADEKKYKSLITKIAIQLGQVKDTAGSNMLQKRMEAAEIALASVQEKLDEHPDYHQLKFSSRTVNIDSLQHTIAGKQEAILSYYYTSGQLLCFYITGDGSGVTATPLQESFFSTIAGLRQELVTPQAAARKSLFDKGAELFNALLLPVYEKIKNKERLIIIPYNEISYVPFEMIPDSRQNGRLLLNEFAVSYQYSANFLLEKKNETVPAYHVLAMAPFAENNIGMILPALPSSAEEINQLPGKQLYAGNALKSQFALLSGQYPVIHLATHAVASDASPLESYIEFYGLKKDADTLHRLYEREIYTLDMKPARLLIISACETGNGVLVNGEGIISLSRAFSYAGCKAVITSLWKADDIATAFIVKRLHYYLQKGLPKDKALQKAKLDYLNNDAIEERFKNPAYWAHLVLIGEYGPLVKPGYTWYSIVIIVSLPLLLLGFMVWKKRNRV